MSHSYNSQNNASQSRPHGQQQYSAQGYSSMGQYAAAQPAGTYQTLSTTTQGYPSQAAPAYNVPHGATYSSGGARTYPRPLSPPRADRSVHPASYPGLHPPAEGRSGGGQQYATGAQYGSPPSAGYATQYAYQQGQPPVSSHSARYLPPASPTAHHAHAHAHSPTHARRGSAHSLGQLQGDDRIPCSKCDKTFSRAHDQKRHYETTHTSNPPVHSCAFCNKGFSRGDSLKRHVDNGCDKDPSFAGAGPSSA